MIERWTIDVIADEIQKGLRDATPSPRLLRRCYRHGYRHGRKAIPAGTARAMITGAVDVAGSAIAQEYVGTRDDLRAQQAQAAGRLSALAATIQGQHPPDTQTAARPTPASPGSPTSLEDALVTLEKRRAQAVLVAHQQKVDELGQQLREAQAAHDLLVQQAQEAPGRFLQRLESCHDAGRLLWARYCQGFVKGASKRGNPDDEDEMSDPTLSFNIPSALIPAPSLPTAAL
jgi:hypothetical protein